MYIYICMFNKDLATKSKRFIVSYQIPLNEWMNEWNINWLNGWIHWIAYSQSCTRIRVPITHMWIRQRNDAICIKYSSMCVYFVMNLFSFILFFIWLFFFVFCFLFLRRRAKEWAVRWGEGVWSWTFAKIWIIKWRNVKKLCLREISSTTIKHQQQQNQRIFAYPVLFLERRTDC